MAARPADVALYSGPMGEVVPVRPLSPGLRGEGIGTPPSPKDKTGAARQRRFRKKRKTRPPAPVTTAEHAAVTPVTHNAVTVSATAGIDVAAYTAAIALAGAAAWFSIRGMVVLFPGAPLSVIAMASILRAVSHGLRCGDDGQGQDDRVCARPRRKKWGQEASHSLLDTFVDGRQLAEYFQKLVEAAEVRTAVALANTSPDDDDNPPGGETEEDDEDSDETESATAAA
jgi:hypothetical protein